MSFAIHCILNCINLYKHPHFNEILWVYVHFNFVANFSIDSLQSRDVQQISQSSPIDV